ncbi:hypothetical protein JTI58_22575 [Lysinibacillus fusiformis]|uniref:hypothetical protein n=2 Tax=Lysinibacillus TaxID=400634 RepID=UPI001967713F|nr:hypothetical protein [Lysinibacillus fusiformis]QSB09726.1 hypothetical protein JTI58_22575 [Lysinibacillus fusiformis]
MIKKIEMGLFVIGIVMALIGMPYLLGYSTNEFLKYPLYLGLIVVVVSFPAKISKKKII